MEEEKLYKEDESPVLCLHCGEPLDDDSNKASDFVVKGSLEVEDHDCGECDASHVIRRLKRGGILFTWDGETFRE